MADFDNQEQVPARIQLEPIAAPSILGLYGLAAATFVASTYLAGWFGTDTITPLVVAPFLALLGGLAQFLASMWAYKARDGVATAMHGVWGSAFLAFAAYAVLAASGVLPLPEGTIGSVGFGFTVLAAITWVGMAAATAENQALAAVWGLMALGSTVLAFAAFVGVHAIVVISAYIFIAASLAAWYAGSALMLEGVFDRAVWPLGFARRSEAPRVRTGFGEPGVIRGQA
jgi:succinate-acetate transporter protein